MGKIEPEAQKHGTDWQLYERGGEVGTDWKEVKGLVKEHTWRTHGHGQQWWDWLWNWGVGWVERGQKGRKWVNCNSINNKISKKTKNMSYTWFENPPSNLKALDLTSAACWTLMRAPTLFDTLLSAQSWVCVYVLWWESFDSHQPTSLSH